MLSRKRICVAGALGLMTLGSLAVASADSSKTLVDPKPDRFIVDGREYHRGKLAETTNDDVINGFSISELPPLPSGGFVGPSCAETVTESGTEDVCFVKTPAEIEKLTARYEEGLGNFKAGGVDRP